MRFAWGIAVLLVLLGLTAALLRSWRTTGAELAVVPAPLVEFEDRTVEPAQLQSVGESLQRSTPVVVAQAAQPSPPQTSAPPSDERSVRQSPNREQDDTARLRVYLCSKDTRLPVPKALIKVFPARSSSSSEQADADGQDLILGDVGRTDPNGLIELGVRAGLDLDLFTGGWKEPHGAAELRLPALALDEIREVVVQVATAEDVRFVGRLVDAESGIVPAGATVVLGPIDDLLPREESPHASGSLPRAHVGGDGYFEVLTFSWQSTLVRADAEGYAPALVEVEPGHEHREQAREVRMRRAASIEATVVGPGGHAWANASVTVSTPAFGLMDGHDSPSAWFTSPASSFMAHFPAEWTQRTGQDGRCWLTGLPPKAPLELQVHAPGIPAHHETDSLSLKPGEVFQATLELGGGATVRGLVLDKEGAPVPAAEVWIQPGWGEVRQYLDAGYEKGRRSARTDASGRFEIRNVYDGAWTAATSPEGPYAPVSQPFRIEAGLADRELVLTAWSGLFLEGTVFDSNGEPLSQSKAFVTAISKDRQLYVNAHTNEAGRFSIGPLPPEDFTLEAEPTRQIAGTPALKSLPVIARAGEGDLELRLRIGCKLSGRLVDAITGAPLEGLVRIQHPGDELRMSNSDPDIERVGAFEFPNLEPGSYDLFGATEGGSFGILTGIEVRAGSEVSDLRLEVKPGGRIRIQYDGASRLASVRILQDGVLVTIFSLRHGSVETVAAPAGSLVVECTEFQPKRTITHSVEVAAGQEVEVTLGNG